MGVEIEIRYDGSLRCTATHGPSGNTLFTDAPVDNGGQGEAFSPTDLVATALGSCMLTIMGLGAAQRSLDITGTTVHVTKDMVADPFRRIGQLTVSIALPAGLSLSEEDRAALENAAGTCPVKKSLHPDTVVTIAFIWPS